MLLVKQGAAEGPGRRLLDVWGAATVEMRFLSAVAPLAVVAVALAVTLARETAKRVALEAKGAAPQTPVAYQLGVGDVVVV